MPDTATGLLPEGPPMVRQVFLDELVDVGGVLRRNDDILAFGWHTSVSNMRPGEVDDKTHPTDSATASNQQLRVVLDELLIGNFIEEIACRDCSWSRVPEGATPDDIANCAVPTDILPQFCFGPMATCLNGPEGAPVGVADTDENGSADDTRMQCSSEESDVFCRQGPVSLRCDDIYVPLDRQGTFYQPAGNQLVPARQTPASSLGPALIVVPFESRLPPSATCRLEFSTDVTDKDHIQICIPTGGEVDTDNLGDCMPGDLSAFSFGTEAVRRDSSSPSRGATGVPTNDRMHYIELTAPVDPTSATPANTVVTEGAGVRTDITVTVGPTPVRINFTFGADLLPNTLYTITISGLRDTFGRPIAGSFDNSFTTGP